MKIDSAHSNSSRSDNIDKITAEHMLRCAELSYRMEIERGENTGARAAKTLTAVSIIAVGVVTSIGLLPPLSAAGRIAVLFSYAIALTLLAVSLILCLLSQFGFPHKSLVSPERVIADINAESSKQPFESEVDAAKHFAISIETSYQSIRANNTRSKKLLNWALGILIFALAFIFRSCILCYAIEALAHLIACFLRPL